MESYSMSKWWRRLWWIGLILIIVAGLVMGFTGDEANVIAFICGLAGLVMALLGVFNLRCPGCGRHLGRRTTDLAHLDHVFCTHCGAKIYME